MKEFKLDEHQKRQEFQTPEGYFDTFPELMMQKLQAEPRVIPLYKRRNTWIFAAAAVLVLSLALPAINEMNANQQPDQSQIENYLANQDLSQDDIVSLLDEEQIKNIQIDYNLEDTSIEAALPSDIENYISD
ncbi:MAG: hypothetical protein EOO48_03030 [Flavobacterium sp.]|nr:MAG: hypothetical protein EOO48_03030 [Flavobacterium sp.]